MTAHYFDEPINTETVNNLVDKLQELKGSVNLYFSTEGGYKTNMIFLVDYLNSRKDDITITLTDIVASAGTMILTDFNGKIKLGASLDYILFHCFDRETYNIRNYEVISTKILIQQDIESNKIFAKKLKDRNILTSQQIKKVLKGKDVVLYRKDFNQLITHTCTR